MPRQSKLKLFRTAIGFHDAYVAAPSQKTALEAWGSDSNLFAVGAAEQVENPDVMREALAHPGAVIRLPRGTMAEHIAALPKAKASPRGRAKPDIDEEDGRRARKGTRAAKAPPAKPKPRPDRAPVDRAEAALADAETRYEDERAALAKRQAELDRARRKLEAAQARERERLKYRLESARDKYERAMRRWRAG